LFYIINSRHQGHLKTGGVTNDFENDL
jgi:hypothetical protein